MLVPGVSVESQALQPPPDVTRLTDSITRLVDRTELSSLKDDEAESPDSSPVNRSAVATDRSLSQQLLRTNKRLPPTSIPSPTKGALRRSGSAEPGARPAAPSWLGAQAPLTERGRARAQDDRRLAARARSSSPVTKTVAATQRIEAVEKDRCHSLFREAQERHARRRDRQDAAHEERARLDREEREEKSRMLQRSWTSTRKPAGTVADRSAQFLQRKQRLHAAAARERAEREREELAQCTFKPNIRPKAAPARAPEGAKTGVRGTTIAKKELSASAAQLQSSSRLVPAPQLPPSPSRVGGMASPLASPGTVSPMKSFASPRVGSSRIGAGGPLRAVSPVPFGPARSGAERTGAPEWQVAQAAADSQRADIGDRLSQIIGHQYAALRLFAGLETKRNSTAERLVAVYEDVAARIQAEETQRVVQFLKTGEGMDFLKGRAAHLRGTKQGVDSMQARIVEELVDESQVEVRQKVYAEVGEMRDALAQELQRERAAILCELTRLDAEAAALDAVAGAYDRATTERVRAATLDLPSVDELRRLGHRRRQGAAVGAGMPPGVHAPSRIPGPSLGVRR